MSITITLHYILRTAQAKLYRSFTELAALAHCLAPRGDSDQTQYPTLIK